MHNTGTARITEHGIEFQNRMYSCQRAIREQWFVGSREKVQLMSVWYQTDESTIFIIDNDGEQVVCRQIDIQQYSGKRLMDYYTALQCLIVSRQRSSKKRTKVSRIWSKLREN